MKERAIGALKKYILVLSFVFISLAGICSTGNKAYAATGSTVVYITKTGKCYHSGNCSSLSKSKIETTVDNAVKKGLRPCSKCNPPQVSKDSSSSTDDSISKSNSTTGSLVWQSATGSCYHSKNNCGNMNPQKATQITEAEAKQKGLSKCSKCW